MAFNALLDNDYLLGSKCYLFIYYIFIESILLYNMFVNWFRY